MANSSVASVPPQQLFGEFFDLGLPETVSPFLKPASRRWGVQLPLRAALLATALLVVAFGLSWVPAYQPLSHLLLVFVYFLAGMPALIESLEDLAAFVVNIDVLMTLAAFASVFIGSGMEGGLLLVLFSLSGAMEEAVTAKAKGAISALHRLTPTRACVVDSDGTILERAIGDVAVGTTILVKAGQVVPLDGTVTEGASSVDLVHLTGESVPVTARVGDTVAAGARTIEGALTLRVTHTSSDSTLSRIIALVTQAHETKPQLQQWFDRCSQGYALTIIALSALTAALLPWAAGLPFLGTGGALYRALAFLIAASPCALIIAIPIAYLSAIGACARQGILLKGGLSLEALAQCRVVAFDKTGTLTTGELSCLGVEPLDTGTPLPSHLWAVAVALERGAVHPIARAIAAAAPAAATAAITVTDFRVIPGYGVAGTFTLEGADVTAFLGNPDYFADTLPPSLRRQLDGSAAAIRARGELLAVLLLGKELFLFRFADTLRPGIADALAALRKHHLQLVMLTGDHVASASRVAAAVGIDTYYADLRPEDKLQKVSSYSSSNGLAMVGDGINDAPALARSTVGICMGKVGSATAAEAADVILLHDTIDRLDWLFVKALATRRIVRENLILALAAIVIASVSALLGIVPLWLAVVLHEGGTVLVGLNALRLLR